MQQTTPQPAATRAPWSPLSIMLIALFFPAGGAILTVRNMQRLKAIDLGKARELTFAVIGVFAVGIVILFIVATGTSGSSAPSQDTAAVLGFGTALASYFVQREPFRTWRTANRSVRTSPWLAALGTALLYTLVTLLVALPVMELARLVAGVSGQGTGTG